MRIVVETADGLNLVETAVEKSGVQEIRHTIILTKVLMDVVGTLQESKHRCTRGTNKIK